MKCPVCKGSRMVFRKVENTVTLVPCLKCNGTGQVKMTNFEDITSSPERLAEFLETVKNACFDCASRGPYKSPDCPFSNFVDDPYGCNILAWLKEEHHDDTD